MTNGSRDIDEMLVVGGGDIGLLTALSVRKLTSDIEVTVVDDFGSEPPEVGKSTYREIVEILHGFLGIPPERFMREAKPLWKGSVYFRDWCGYDRFHYPFDDSSKYPATDTPDAIEQYYLHYEETHADPDRLTVDEAMVEGGKSPLYYDPDAGGYSSVGDAGDEWAYHLDLHRFNEFLRTVCEERGVALVDDTITAVDTDGEHVEAVHSETASYDADLYVDASGFNRVLKGELDDEFRPFELPLDAAVKAKHPRDLSDAVPATVIETGEYGWFWQIDTYDFRDVGYVYGSEFVDDDDAAAEFLEHVGPVEAEDLVHYEFDSGYHETPWQGNCVTIGNAVGFVEPLQSTGLTANAQSARKLANLLAGGGAVDPDGTGALYNEWTTRLWESIYDFISLHYRYSDGDTAFWEAAGSVPASPRLQRLIDHFDEHGYDTKTNPLANAPGAESWPATLVFPAVGFFSIMRNMGAESSFYEQHPVEVSERTRENIAEFYESTAAKADQLLSVEEAYRGLLDWEEPGGV